MAHKGYVQWLTGDYRIYRVCVQGMTGKTQGVTGEDEGFSYGQGFSEPVVKINL